MGVDLERPGKNQAGNEQVEIEQAGKQAGLDPEQGHPADNISGLELSSDNLSERSTVAQIESLENAENSPQYINQQKREEMMLEQQENSNHTRPARGSWVKRNKILLVAISILLIVTASAGIALGVYTRDTGVICQGIEIYGIPVGNLTTEQAKVKVEAKVKQILAETVKINIESEQVALSKEQLGLSFNTAAVVEQAYKVGNEGSITQKATDRRKAAQGINLNLKASWDEKTLTAVINKEFAKFNQPAKDASFTINSQNKMVITDSKVGRDIDIAALVAQVKGADLQAAEEITAAFKAEQPKLSKSTLESQQITGLISSYSTKFDASQINRTVNVKTAAKTLDGTVIKPGAIFSFNDVVGERTVNAGYKDAFVIVDGVFVPGLGGGICQVSSTLYNTILLGNLPITERSNHSLAITYVPLGRDATVAYPSLDFKFKNDTGGYLLIRSRVQGNTLTFDLYGKVKPGVQVILSTVTEQTLKIPVQRVKDNSLPAGTQRVKQKGQQGYVVSTYRTVKVNGKVVKTENLGKSRYQAEARIIATGP